VEVEMTIMPTESLIAAPRFGQKNEIDSCNKGRAPFRKAGLIPETAVYRGRF